MGTSLTVVVFVDDMRAPYGRMLMCHLIADTDEELHAMAARVGVARRWFQDRSRYHHYDLSLGKRASDQVRRRPDHAKTVRDDVL